MGVYSECFNVHLKVTLLNRHPSYEEGAIEASTIGIYLIVHVKYALSFYGSIIELRVDQSSSIHVYFLDYYFVFVK